MPQNKNEVGRPARHGKNMERFEIRTRQGLKAKLEKFASDEKISVSEYSEAVLFNHTERKGK